MAFPVSVALPTGVTATRAEIRHASVDFGAGKVSAVVLLYLDQAALDAGRAPLDQRNMEWPSEQVEAATGEIALTAALEPFVAAALEQPGVTTAPGPAPEPDPAA